MPEGDTIHRLANALRPRLLGELVVSLRLRRAEFPLGAFAGARVEKVEALGKHLLVHFDNAFLLHAHLGMTGVVRCYDRGMPRRGGDQNVAFSLATTGCEVVGFRVPRVRVLRAANIHEDPVLSGLGQDLLAQEVSIGNAVQDLRLANDEPIGVAIMDQRIFAGVGNVIKSEILFRLKLDPFVAVRAHSDAQLAELLEDARAVLKFNVESAGHRRITRFDKTHHRRAVSVYGRKDEPCFDCGTRIDMRRQGRARRSTYFCPLCQRVPPASSSRELSGFAESPLVHR